ncbi:outer membrane autotransporter barrel domain-containing protein [Pseudomonas asplenii]|uniref:Outer membrane autotransporter barrel domain-containing protein n=2 Tax=Pseudomonas asplenii TaxID=53407 RepID=A0A1H2A396_9PSED|nr:outer membrane autotransporter barrel domain-containing protein [Pseudomonas asplenii]
MLYQKRMSTGLIHKTGLKVIGLSCGATLSLQVQAVQIDNGNAITGTVSNRIETLNASSPVESWSVMDRGLLQIFDGAVTQSVSVRGNARGVSDVQINNGTVNGGLELTHGRATIVNGTINNPTGRALQVSTLMNGGSPLSSSASLQDSSVSGMGIGAIVSPLGQLSLNHSSVTAVAGAGNDGEAIRLAGSALQMTNGSYARGESVGLHIIGDTSGPGSPPIDSSTEVVLDHSTLEGLSGPAIRIVDGSRADIVVQNGSNLLSGNGTLLDVRENSTVGFTVGNSVLTGDLIADGSSTLDVTLQNNAQLTGNLVNTHSVAINSSANWTMVADAELNSLSLGGGSVTLGSAGQFHTLSLGELSGTGLFNMQVNLLGGTGDLLNVEGEANGRFLLDVENTGQEPDSPEITPLQVVHTEGGDALFEVVGGSIDLGVYSYQLERQGDDWFIVGSGKTISPSTQAALGLFSVGPTVWYGELATLRSRLGEIRTSGAGGGWIRGYGSQYNVTADAGFGYKQRQRGLSLGFDVPVPVRDGQLLVGVLAGHSESDLSLSRGTAGKVGSGYIGAYGTWLRDDGYYLDGLVKVNRFRNQADVAMTNGVKAKGSYDNIAYGGSLEFGKHIVLSQDVFIEPYAQWSTVVVKGDRYTLDNGLSAQNDHTLSMLGKAGATLGRNLELADGGLLQPYLRAAVVHEFSRSGNTVKVNDAAFDNSLFGTRAELGAGVSAALSKNLQLHAHFDYMKGEHIEQPWGVNVGLRYGF